MPHLVWWLSILCPLQCPLNAALLRTSPLLPQKEKKSGSFLFTSTSPHGAVYRAGVSVCCELTCPTSLLCMPRAQPWASASLRAKSGSYSLFLFSKHPSIRSVPRSPVKPRFPRGTYHCNPKCIVHIRVHSRRRIIYVIDNCTTIRIQRYAIGHLLCRTCSSLLHPNPWQPLILLLGPYFYLFQTVIPLESYSI